MRDEAIYLATRVVDIAGGQEMNVVEFTCAAECPCPSMTPTGVLIGLIMGLAIWYVCRKLRKA